MRVISTRAKLKLPSYSLRYLFFILSIYVCGQVNAQLSGSYNVPSTYTSVAAVIADLNTLGVNGPVTVNIASGYTETAPVGGLVLNTIAGASATSSIIFQKSGTGANPVITAYTGTATPASALQDGIWRFIGSDFITIDGIDLYDPNTSNPATMEFGYCFFKAGATNGCQNNVIRNCVITLNRVNNVAGISPAGDGSRGIEMVNALSLSHTTPVTVSSAAGANSFNKFYNNTIQNCNTGIMLSGFYIAFTNDTNNDVGGISASSGNTIINYGGGGSLSSAYGIRAISQANLNLGYNKINNNTGPGVNHPVTLGGIFTTDLDGITASIINNTVTINGAGSSHHNTAIKNTAVLTGPSVSTISILGNLITNCSYSTATSGHFYGIQNNGIGAHIDIKQNTFTNNSTAATSGTFCNILNAGMVHWVEMSSNSVSLGTFNAAATSVEVYGICQTFSDVVVYTDNNSFQNCNYSGATGGSGPLTCISNLTTQASFNANSNTFNALTVKTSGDVTFISNNSTTFQNVISSNSVTNGFTNTATGSLYGYYCNAGSSGVGLFTGNNYSNITLTGNGSFYGMYEASGRIGIINNNVFNNISTGSGTLCGLRHSMAASSLTANTVSNFSSAGTIYGIYGGGPGINSANDVSRNLVHALSSSGAAPVYGIYHSGTASTTINGNKIYDLSGTDPASRVSGIYCHNTNYITVSNNLVGDLRTPSATSSSCSITGIELYNGYYNKLYYNTVMLNATSSGASFGSAAVFVQPSIDFTMSNNIFINNSIPTGTAITAAFLGNTYTGVQYNILSDHNLFYAGTPSANKVIYYDGTTTYSTLPIYKTTFVYADQNAVTENVSFLSTTGSNANFLHIDPTVGSYVESGGITIAGYTRDYDVQIRQGETGYTGTGTAPDIGADEYNQNLCTQGSAGVLSASSLTLCEAKTFTVNATNNSLFQGINYKWKVASAPGGPYSNVSGGTGSTTTSYTTDLLNTPGTFYYVLSSTCAVTGNTAVSNQLTVTVNPFPTATLTANSNTLCPNQSLSLTAISNGVSFLWTGPNFSSALQNPLLAFIGTLGGGTYSVKVTSAAGCMKTFTLPITVISLSNVSAVAIPSVICAGETTTLYASGSANSFTWSGSSTNTSVITITPQVTSVITVSAQTSTCPMALASVSVFVNPQPTFSVASSPTVLCLNMPAILSVTGSNTYSWSTGATGNSISITPPLAAGYSVTATNSDGCSLTLGVASNSLPVIMLSAASSTICEGTETSLFVYGASSYAWSTGEIGPAVSVQPNSSQIYTVTGTDINTCKNTATVSVSVDACLSVSEIQRQTGISVFPNPTTRFVTVSFSNNEPKQIVITTVAAEIIYEKQTTASFESVDLLPFAKGVYFVRVHSSSGWQSYKLIHE